MSLTEYCRLIGKRRKDQPLIWSNNLSAVNEFIVNMTKLLDADWLAGVQLFH